MNNKRKSILKYSILSGISLVCLVGVNSNKANAMPQKTTRSKPVSTSASLRVSKAQKQGSLDSPESLLEGSMIQQQLGGMSEDVSRGDLGARPKTNTTGRRRKGSKKTQPSENVEKPYT